MKPAADVRAALGDAWIPQIYEEKIRTLRTRSFKLDVPERENHTEILHTLLGVELKVGKKRIACPDLSNARYLAVFARIGCGEIAVPYDITALPALADELETAWHRMLLVFSGVVSGSTAQMRGRERAALLREIRQTISKIGAGAMMPLFNTSTKQRRN